MAGVPFESLPSGAREGWLRESSRKPHQSLYVSDIDGATPGRKSVFQSRRTYNDPLMPSYQLPSCAPEQAVSVSMHRWFFRNPSLRRDAVPVGGPPRSSWVLGLLWHIMQGMIAAEHAQQHATTLFRTATPTLTPWSCAFADRAPGCCSTTCTGGPSSHWPRFVPMECSM